MESKYYTPDESEFHKGFEYEIPTYNPQNDIGPDEEAVWNKVRFPDPFVGWQVDKIKGARVKYLDKESIQECGWKQSVQKNRYFIEKISLSVIDTENLWIEIRDTGFPEPVGGKIFHGVLKNKSELLKLMQQLGIK